MSSKRKESMAKRPRSLESVQNPGQPPLKRFNAAPLRNMPQITDPLEKQHSSDDPVDLLLQQDLESRPPPLPRLGRQFIRQKIQDRHQEESSSDPIYLGSPTRISAAAVQELPQTASCREGRHFQESDDEFDDVEKEKGTTKFRGSRPSPQDSDNSGSEVWETSDNPSTSEEEDGDDDGDSSDHDSLRKVASSSPEPLEKQQAKRKGHRKHGSNRRLRPKKRGITKLVADREGVSVEEANRVLCCGADSETLQQHTKTRAELLAQLYEAIDKLSINTTEITALFKKLGLPLSMDRMLILSSREGKEGTKTHKASTVTKELLMDHGFWEFDESSNLRIDGNKKTIHPSAVYVAVSMVKKFLKIDYPPITMQTTGSLPAALVLHSEILHHLTGVKRRFEDAALKFFISNDWGTEAIKNDNVDNALLLPYEYEEILRCHQVKVQREEAFRELALPPSSPPAASDVGTPKTNGGLHSNSSIESLSIEDEPANLVTPERHSLALPPATGQNIPKSAAESPSRAGCGAQSVAERLVMEYDLKPTLEGAQRLEQLIEELEPEYMRRRSLYHLCQIMGTAEERRGLQAAKGDVRFRSVEYAEREVILMNDKSERAGNTLMGEDAEHSRFGAVETVLLWANFQSDQLERDGRSHPPSEVAVETLVGGLVKGLFWAHEHIDETENAKLRVVECLRLFGTAPKPDYAACLALPDENGQLCMLLVLCLLAGECKPRARFQARKSKTEAQLAMNSVAPLIILIIMHLSIRTEENQKLLPWMYLYAFVYTEIGITIYAHFPKWDRNRDGSSQWKFVSWKVTTKFEKMWEKKGWEDLRMQCLAVLYMIRSHTEFVMEQILNWTRHLPPSAAPIMELLVNRAHWELRNYDLLLRKLHIGQKKRIGD